MNLRLKQQLQSQKQSKQFQLNLVNLLVRYHRRKAGVFLSNLLYYFLERKLLNQE